MTISYHALTNWNFKVSCSRELHAAVNFMIFFETNNLELFMTISYHTLTTWNFKVSNSKVSAVNFEVFRGQSRVVIQVQLAVLQLAVLCTTLNFKLAAAVMELGTSLKMLSMVSCSCEFQHEVVLADHLQVVHGPAHDLAHHMLFQGELQLRTSCSCDTHEDHLEVCYGPVWGAAVAASLVRLLLALLSLARMSWYDVVDAPTFML
jgi:hypothetical protein